MKFIPAFPGFISIILLLKYTPRKVFIHFFLPILVLYPTYYRVEFIRGTPDLSFWSTAFLPIFLAWILIEKAQGYRFSVVDLLILFYIFFCAYSEYYNGSYESMRKLLFNDIITRFFPYLMAKSCFAHRELRDQMMKVLVITGSFVALFTMYEFRMWYNVFDDAFRKIWPEVNSWNQTAHRYGYKRASASFGHPICAGYCYAMLLPLAMWLLYTNKITKDLWAGIEKHYVYLILACLLSPFVFLVVDINKNTILACILAAVVILVLLLNKRIIFDWGILCMLLLIGGTFACISRAPIIVIFLGMVGVLFGWSKNKKMWLLVGVILLVIITPFVISDITSYVKFDRRDAGSHTQSTLAYRLELIVSYSSLVMEKPILGWGNYGYPSVNKQDSIDNEYLLQALNYGLCGLLIYLFFICFILMRLVVFLEFSVSDEEKKLAWCLLAVWISALIIQLTVFRGTQTLQLFYMFAGAIEALYLSTKKPIREMPTSLFSFKTI